MEHWAKMGKKTACYYEFDLQCFRIKISRVSSFLTVMFFGVVSCTCNPVNLEAGF